MPYMHVYCCRVGDKFHNPQTGDVHVRCWKCDQPVWLSVKTQDQIAQYEGLEVRHICLVCMNEWEDCKPPHPLRFED
jgi:hypothetical protein